MMLTLHGLPNKTKFQDVKALINQECNIPDFILDNLVDDGYDAKKVRIGLTNENDGYRLMKCLEGYRMFGSHVLRVVPVGKTQSQTSNFEQQSSYSNPPRNDYPENSRTNYAQNEYNRSSALNPQSHVSPHSAVRKTGVSDMRHDRGLHDARQSLSQVMADSRAQDRYSSSIDHRLGSDVRGQPGPETRTDFRDPNRGPLLTPAIRPASMDAIGLSTRQHGMVATASHGTGIRGQDTVGYRASNPEPVNRQSAWAPVGNDQWSGSVQSTLNQNTGYNYQQPQVNTAYGQQSTQASYSAARAPQPYQQPKPAPERPPVRSHVLRSVEIVDTPIQPRAPLSYPPQQKPITIMKDNFQGPTQYNVTGQVPGSQTYNQGSSLPVWNHQAQSQTKQLAYDKSYDDRRQAQQKPLAKPQPSSQDYEKRRFSPTRLVRAASPLSEVSPASVDASDETAKRRSPPRNVSRQTYLDRRVSPTRAFTSEYTGRNISPAKSPQARRNSPTRKISPRRLSPNGRRSPFARKTSPGRRMSPVRRASPKNVSPVRRISPFRKLSPPGRRVSPFGRKISPTRMAGRHLSPTGRHVSPHGKMGSPRRDERRMSPSMTQYDYYVEGERRMGRLESPRRYSPKRSPPRGSGRYSPSETKYDTDIPGTKGAKPIRPAYEAKQAQKYTGAGAGFRPSETQYSAASARNEVKISPWQNEKIVYPLKKEERETRIGRSDMTEKNISPRRSRSRSPLKDRFRRHSPSPRSPRRSWALEKRRSPDPVREPPPPPLWPGQDVEEKPKHPVWERNELEEDRRFDDKRGRNEDKYTPRFSPRREVDDRREYGGDKFERNYSPERKEYRRESPRREEKKLFNEVDKDFNDIYQRAVEFRRKTEELRKSNDRRNRSYESPEEDKAPARDREPSPRLDRSDNAKPNWIPIKIQSKDVDKERTKMWLEPAIKDKRDKASVEIANRILEPHNFTGEQRQRVMEELKLTVTNIMLEMFKDQDVSYIELVIKFRARYDAKDEEKILLDVMASMPSHYKKMLKRKGEGITEVPPKIARVSPAYGREEPTQSKLSAATIPDWNIPIGPPKVITMPQLAHPVPPMMVQPSVYLPMHPQMYQPDLQANMHSNINLMPSTIVASIQSQMQPDFEANMQEIQSRMQSHIESNMMKPQLQPETQQNISEQEGYNLYLCQDDFEPFSENQAEKLRAFLVSQMFKASETGDGWAPDFAFKGLHSMHRYELSTKDEVSKNWIQNLDFSDFEFFNVLVYTKEELWYERAAIWLPGHSRYRNLEPLEKLRLQNRHAVGINIGKWKFVKKIVTAKGTRLYVDMPPSSARALEKQKMMLSYELGKVNVYLKAVAVDKEVFDAGLKAYSITDPSELATAVQNSTMPTLPSQQVGMIKVTLNGAKSLTIQQAGKIKEMIIYNLFKYHQQGGRCKTDFEKYGFCPPNCVGLVPENSETKKWLMGQSFGKLNRQAIVVLDGEDAHIKYFRMFGTFAISNQKPSFLYVIEKLRTSNKGVKGLNFQFWKVITMERARGKTIIEIDVDLESAETLIKLNFKLDYVTEDHITITVRFRSDYSLSKLQEKIKKYKAEQVDSYDVANMELDSDSD